MKKTTRRDDGRLWSGSRCWPWPRSRRRRPSGPALRRTWFAAATRSRRSPVASSATEALARDPQGEPAGHQPEPHLPRGHPPRAGPRWRRRPTAASWRRARAPRAACRGRTDGRRSRRGQRACSRQCGSRDRHGGGGRRARTVAGRPVRPVPVVSPAQYRSAGHIADNLPTLAIVASPDDRSDARDRRLGHRQRADRPRDALHGGSRRPAHLPPEDGRSTSAGWSGFSAPRR